MDIRQANHSTVAIQELMHTIGVLDPRHPRTKTAIGQIKTTIAAMPDHRIFTPDADVLGRGAMLSGILCRIQGYQQDARLRALHDCVLFLQAQKLGLMVLTANVSDFDYLLQLMPTSRVLLYRVAARRTSLAFDISQVLKLDPTSAYGLYLRVKMLRGYGATSQLGEALDQAITAYPRYMPLHQIVLSTLQPKWGAKSI
ncbi:hypothetical protein ACC764_25030 [Rhizobium ruizarguesonis]|uniref:hypothetical protein n=1 Tax=Rhizobium ruizarguesonis TaxID=2081791 RepID=UPI001FE15703|nr:hypothetical protein [Rhizobium ruizarguesonis]